MCKQWWHTLLSHSIIKKSFIYFSCKDSNRVQHSFRYFLVVANDCAHNTHIYTRCDNNDSDIGTAHSWQWRQWRRRRQWQAHHQLINSTFFSNLHIQAEYGASQTTATTTKRQQRKKIMQCVYGAKVTRKNTRVDQLARAYTQTHIRNGRSKTNRFLSEGEKAI